MLQASTLTFLGKLSKNNNKTWFDNHREDYLAAKEDYEQLIAGILTDLSVKEPRMKDQKAKDCIFRIFRDVRFSKDKTPYKAHFGAAMSIGGRKYPGAVYYLHIEPGGKSFAGGGLWMPETPLLRDVRQEIDYNFDEFKKIVSDKSFKKFFKKIEGETLKTLPQGYKEDNPAIEYLKMKSLTVGYSLDDKEVAGKGMRKKVVEVFIAMKPFIDFLNRSVP